MQRRFSRGLWGGVLVALLVTAVASAFIGRSDGTEHSVASSKHAEERLQRAFETRQEDFWIEASGQVVRLLPDDLSGSRHQRIVVALDSGQTLLIAHNIDLAPRLDAVSPGDRLHFRGKYVWNTRGGVIHWTHHDPDGSSAGGWLALDGRRYR